MGKRNFSKYTAVSGGTKNFLSKKQLIKSQECNTWVEGALRTFFEVSQSCSTLCDPMDCSLPGSSVHGIFQSTGVGCHFLLQGIFPTQGSNLGLLHCRQMLYHLSHLREPYFDIWGFHTWKLSHLRFHETHCAVAVVCHLQVPRGPASLAGLTPTVRGSWSRAFSTPSGSFPVVTKTEPGKVASAICRLLPLSAAHGTLAGDVTEEICLLRRPISSVGAETHPWDFAVLRTQGRAVFSKDNICLLYSSMQAALLFPSRGGKTPWLWVPPSQSWSL